MLNIILNPWVTNTTKASISWKIEDLYNDGIAKVEYNIRKEGSLGIWMETAGSTGEAAIDVTNYTGKVFFDIKVTDFSGQIVTAASETSVDNFIPPTPPDWLSYEAEDFGIFAFKWGTTVAPSPTVASWRLINTDALGNIRILAEKPVYERQADVPITIDKLHMVSVLGVDSDGRVSKPSPVLSFFLTENGPQIVLSPWSVNVNTAIIDWSIASSSALQDIRWTITDGSNTLASTALPIGKTSIPVKDFVGRVTFTITAIDNQRRISTMTSYVDVYNRTPGAVTVKSELVGVRFIKVSAIPPVDPEVPIDLVKLYGPSGVVDLYAPFIHTFEELTPSTDYKISAKAVNRTGISGPVSSPLTIRTSPDPLAPTTAPQPDAGAPVVQQIASLLEGDLRYYLLQLYTDTRIRRPRANQIVHPPAELDLVLDLYLPIASQFGDFIRRDPIDQATYEASELIDRTGDPLEKLAIFCERLEHGSIWNLA